MKTALELLRLATERWPPKHPASHHLCLSDDKDEPGVLMFLILFIGDKSWPVGLEAADIDRAPGDLLDDVARMMAKFEVT